jgi:hypothetical protein
MGGLEQFDEVAGRVGEQDLAPAGAGDHIVAEGQSGGAQPADLGVEVVDDEVDAVPSAGYGLSAVGEGSGA